MLSRSNVSVYPFVGGHLYTRESKAEKGQSALAG